MPRVTREEQRESYTQAYLEGRARKPHSHSRTIRRSLESRGSGTSDICAQCEPVLSRHIAVFKGMVHTGSELKRRKRLNPNPKRTGAVQYRDLSRQNHWLKANMFDSMGNYLYCSACIRAAFGLSTARLTCLRLVKRRECSEPIATMTKVEVEEQRLGQCVVMPSTLDCSFKSWWRSVDPTDQVEVRTPHGRHGNAGKESHSAKSTVRQQFLQFVDMNSQPNGRSADSSGPTIYFSPKFTTIQMPKKGTSHYQERVKRSVVGEFNRTQRESGHGECSNGSSHNWLKSERPKVAICPHREDYCDTCSKHKISINAKQTTINRLKQASNSEPEEIKKLEAELVDLKEDHEQHRQRAQKAHECYVKETASCASRWKQINELDEKTTRTDEEEETLATLKLRFNLVLCADYQQCKLVPYWGMSDQPGSTYYLQKVNHDLFGIVNHGDGSSAVYLFDETIGPKNTDHTLSFLTHYIRALPSWVKRVHIFLDNTSSTNKNFYTMAWAMELVQQDEIDFLRISFLIAGHTKFSPDLLFSKIAQTYNRSDVFNTEELGDIVSRYANVTIANGTMVYDWRTLLCKYSKLPGIRSLHDFLFVKHAVTNQLVAKVRENCYEGAFNDSPIHVVRGRSLEENCIADQDSVSYSTLGKERELTETKYKHLQQMYRDFIPEHRRMPSIKID